MARRHRSVGLGFAIAIAIAVAVCAAITVTASVAEAAIVRSFAVHNGVTTVELRVPHRTGTSPPAILLSTRPAGLGCSVVDYFYGNRGRAGRFALLLRCGQVPRGARARLVFRAPYLRVFPLRNGAGTIRVRVDTPPGNALPLGELTTRPQDTDCQVTPTGRHAGPRRFTATARVRCRGLPAHARGVLAVGGLLTAPGAAAGVIGTGRTESRSFFALPSTAAARRTGCTSPSTFHFKAERAVSYKECYTGPFTLRPWRSQFVGIGGPTPGCEPGWARTFAALQAPAAWLAIGPRRSDVDLITDPTNAWWYSWAFGLVTNWQFSGDITFNFEYRCFRLN
ncbi:MAG: hypothetical protein ACJ76X_15780 [Solirubrobacteraceae bacterium]